MTPQFLSALEALVSSLARDISRAPNRELHMLLSTRAAEAEALLRQARGETAIYGE